MIQTYDLSVAVFSPQADTPIADIEVIAILDRVETDGGYIVQQRVTARTNENGEAVLSLWPNSRGSGDSRYVVFVPGYFEVALDMPARDCRLEDVAGAPLADIDLSTSTLARLQRLRDETVDTATGLKEDVDAVLSAATLADAAASRASQAADRSDDAKTGASTAAGNAASAASRAADEAQDARVAAASANTTIDDYKVETTNTLARIATGVVDAHTLIVSQYELS